MARTTGGGEPGSLQFPAGNLILGLAFGRHDKPEDTDAPDSCLSSLSRRRRRKPPADST